MGKEKPKERGVRQMKVVQERQKRRKENGKGMRGGVGEGWQEGREEKEREKGETEGKSRRWQQRIREGRRRRCDIQVPACVSCLLRSPHSSGRGAASQAGLPWRGAKAGVGRGRSLPRRCPALARVLVRMVLVGWLRSRQVWTRGHREAGQDKQGGASKGWRAKRQAVARAKGTKTRLGQVKGASKAASKQQAASPKKQKAQTKRPHLQKPKRQGLKKPL